MGSTEMLRIIFLVLNIPYLVLGAALLLIAEAGLKEMGELGTLVLNAPFNIGWVVIVIGAWLFLISLFGCCGALRESRFELKTFAILVFILLVVEVAILIVAFIYRDKLEDTKLKLTLRETLKQYNTSALIFTAWNELQPQFNCCGVDNYTDWADDPPKSCCKKSFPKKCPKEFLFVDGCWKKLKDTWLSRATIIGVVGIISLFLQVTGVVMACSLKYFVYKRRHRRHRRERREESESEEEEESEDED